MSDSPQNNSYTMRNRPLGASEQGRTRLGEKIETMGFVTDLALRAMVPCESRYLRGDPLLDPAAIFTFSLLFLH